MGYSNREENDWIEFIIIFYIIFFSSLDRFLAVNCSVYRVKSVFNHGCNRSSRDGGDYRTEAVYRRIVGTREMFFSNWPPPFVQPSLHRCKNSFSRFSIPIIRLPFATRGGNRSIGSESFLNYPAKTKGNRCGYRKAKVAG